MEYPRIPPRPPDRVDTVRLPAICLVRSAILEEKQTPTIFLYFNPVSGLSRSTESAEFYTTAISMESCTNTISFVVGMRRKARTSAIQYSLLRARNNDEHTVQRRDARKTQINNNRIICAGA